METIKELKLEDFVAGIPGGFFIYRADGDEEILYANSEVWHLYGCGTDEEFRAFTGNSFKGMVHPEDLEWVEESIHEQIKVNQKKFDYVEYRIIPKDGGQRWVEDFGHLVKNSIYGEIFFVFVSDVTDKVENSRKIENQYLRRIRDQELLQAVIQSTIYAYREVYIVNLKENYGRMIYPEDKDDKEKGNYKKIIERHFEEGILSRESEELVRNMLQPESMREALMGKNSVEYQYRKRKPDGTMEWCATTVTVSERENGVPVTVVMCIRSVESIIKKEEQQKTILESALLNANQANEAKTVFLTNMSHDMRTPMNGIMGFCDLAMRHVEEPERVRDCLRKILESSHILLGIIDNMLDMSRIESGQLNLERSENNLVQIMNDVYGLLKDSLDSKKISYVLDMRDVKHEWVYCDLLRMHQILINVVGNAVKFTQPGGSIMVTVKEKPSLSEGIANYFFHIRDTGIGMTPEFMEKVFQPFERERTSTVSKIPGTGLGLAVTKNIVDLMNGSIEVESEIGKGSEFTISLSFRVRKQAIKMGDLLQMATETVKTDNLAGKWVLLVEDNELNREIAKALLEEEGLIVDEADDGDVAVEMVRNSKGRYDFVLMDIQMPRMNGYKAAKAIRGLEDEKLAAIPIIAMSANALEEDQKESLRSGMDMHLAKPIEMDKVLAALEWMMVKSDPLA